MELADLPAMLSGMTNTLLVNAARREGHAGGYREGAVWSATLLLDRACEIKDADARRVVQGLAREILASLQQPPAPAAAVEPKPTQEVAQPVERGS